MLITKILRPELLNAAYVAEAMYAATPDMASVPDGTTARALAWDEQPEAIRDAQIDLAQLLLDRLVEQGVLGGSMPTAPLPKGFEALPGAGSSPGDMAAVPAQIAGPQPTADAEAIRRQTPEEALAEMVKETK